MTNEILLGFLSEIAESIMSVLAIDIGNSRVGFNVFTGGKAQDPAIRLHHHELDKDLAATLKTLWERAGRESEEAGNDDTEVVIASVVPELTQRVANSVRQYLDAITRVVGRDIKVPLKTMLRDETTVGQDRLLAALAAYVHVEKACAIVQVGTALVVDCIDDEGIFRGGAIAPGLLMGAKALHDFTAQLPEPSLTPPAEDVPFGRFTQEAINLGLYAGLRGTVRELCWSGMRRRWGVGRTWWRRGGMRRRCWVIATWWIHLCRTWFVQGAALAWEKYREE